MSLRDHLLIGVTAVHRTVFKLSRGRLTGGIYGMPVLELVTTGAKSGQRRSVMLTSPLRQKGSLVVVASKGGDPRSPAWYHNLVAHPEVEVTLGDRTATMHARVLDSQEREALWPKVVDAYKGYGGYQEKTAREIPLVVLEGDL